MKTPTLSVILCTYNREIYLIRAIESILNQSFNNFELILVNNGSNKSTKSICDEYTKKDSRIKLVNIEKNIGASFGRNVGINTAKTNYITFVDDDDYCEPNMLEELIRLKDLYNADISVCGGWFEINDNLIPYYIFPEEIVLNKVQGLNELLKREKYNVAPPAKLFRKEYFLKHPFLNNVLVDDIHTIYKVFSEADKIAVNGKPVYRWRKHASNMTGFIENNELTPEILDEYLFMQDIRVEYLCKNVPEIRKRVEYSRWSYMISMCEKISTYKLNNCMNQYERMINFIEKNMNNFINSEYITDKELKFLKDNIKDRKCI